MVGDVFRLNDLRAWRGIELSLLATLCALQGMSMLYEPILRMFRIA